MRIVSLYYKEFIGIQVPFGALVLFFKPSGARKVDQDHKSFDLAIPSVFAGYNMGRDPTGTDSIFVGNCQISQIKTSAMTRQNPRKRC